MAFDIRRVARKVRFARWIAAALLVLTPVSGCGARSGDDPTNDPTTLSVEAQQDLMTRWNAAADGVVISGGFTFSWEAFDQFPHPTYKGGTKEAYWGFAEILIAFYEKGDNFDYLTRNKYFSITLGHIFPSGQMGVQTSFAQLTEDFSNNDWIPAATRDKLATFVARIRAAQ
jgi:hypothetical protein